MRPSLTHPFPVPRFVALHTRSSYRALCRTTYSNYLLFVHFLSFKKTFLSAFTQLLLQHNTHTHPFIPMVLYAFHTFTTTAATTLLILYSILVRSTNILWFLPLWFHRLPTYFTLFRGSVGLGHCHPLPFPTTSPPTHTTQTFTTFPLPPPPAYLGTLTFPSTYCFPYITTFFYHPPVWFGWVLTHPEQFGSQCLPHLPCHPTHPRFCLVAVDVGSPTFLLAYYPPLWFPSWLVPFPRFLFFLFGSILFLHSSPWFLLLLFALFGWVGLRSHVYVFLAWHWLVMCVFPTPFYCQLPHAGVGTWFLHTPGPDLYTPTTAPFLLILHCPPPAWRAFPFPEFPLYTPRATPTIFPCRLVLLRTHSPALRTWT